jgi:hypothetical protein
MARRIRLVEALSHERIEDEVIVINLETGAYFAFDGPAAECWTIVDAGGGLDDIVSALTTWFGVDAHTATADAEAFMDALVEHGLARDDSDAAGRGPLPAPAPRAARQAYTTPMVDPYDDLETLLLIDPIHEVDDAGWPLPATEDA